MWPQHAAAGLGQQGRLSSPAPGLTLEQNQRTRTRTRTQQCPQRTRTAEGYGETHRVPTSMACADVLWAFSRASSSSSGLMLDS